MCTFTLQNVAVCMCMWMHIYICIYTHIVFVDAFQHRWGVLPMDVRCRIELARFSQDDVCHHAVLCQKGVRYLAPLVSSLQGVYVYIYIYISLECSGNIGRENKKAMRERESERERERVPEFCGHLP